MQLNIKILRISILCWNSLFLGSESMCAVKYQPSANFDDHSTKFKFQIDKMLIFAPFRQQSTYAVKYQNVGQLNPKTFKFKISLHLTHINVFREIWNFLWKSINQNPKVFSYCRPSAGSQRRGSRQFMNIWRYKCN